METSTHQTTGSSRRVTIVGGGVAGAALVGSLRRHGFEGPISLIDAQSHLPYDRPPLSKATLEPGEPECPVFEDARFYDKHNVELVLGRTVTNVDTHTRNLVLDDQDIMGYDILVLALGLEARMLPIPGSNLGGVHVLRTFNDAMELRASMAESEHVLIIGGGFIGAEIASAARSRGLQTTVVEIGPYPMARVLAPTLGAFCADLMASHGVNLRTLTAVAELRGSSRIETAILDDGTKLAVDTVVIGVGTQLPKVLIDGHPLNSPGVEVDDGYRSTHPDVYAVGDVAARSGNRSAEQWTNAIESARHLGRTLASGVHAPAAPAVPYGWSQQFGHTLQVVGDLLAGERIVTYGDEQKRLTLTGDSILRGAFAFDHGKALMLARRLINEQAPWEQALTRIASLGLGKPDTEERLAAVGHN